MYITFRTANKNKRHEYVLSTRNYFSKDNAYSTHKYIPIMLTTKLNGGLLFPK